jgi:hypothetical protein
LVFFPEAWHTITDVKILKKVGIYDVELMHTIQLMHAKFSMNNKKLGRDMMSFAELCRTLAAEEFGSPKKHQAILATLNKRLTNDILPQLRLAGALYMNDAKSSYDHIVHNIAILEKMEAWHDRSTHSFNVQDSPAFWRFGSNVRAQTLNSPARSRTR